MPLPQIKVCVSCTRKFNAFSDSQDTCTSCLSKPHRQTAPIDPEEIEASLAELEAKHAEGLDDGHEEDPESHFKRPPPTTVTTIKVKNIPERTCPGCHRPFTPTSGVQKWCSACGKQREIDSKKRWADRQALKDGKISVPTTPKIKKIEREVAEINKRIEKTPDKSYNSQTTELRSELIIGLLVQLELVTPAQIELCDKFIREMQAYDGKLPEM